MSCVHAAMLLIFNSPSLYAIGLIARARWRSERFTIGRVTAKVVLPKSGPAGPLLVAKIGPAGPIFLPDQIFRDSFRVLNIFIVYSYRKYLHGTTLFKYT